MSARESVYLEKRNYKPINGTIKDNIDLCKRFVHLYENDYITKQDLIYIAALINDVKPGISCSDRQFSKSDCSIRGYDIRESPIYESLTNYQIPFRVDVYGAVESTETHQVTLSDKHSLFTISRDFSNIQKLPPFHHISENNTMRDIENKYLTEWGNFLGVPKKDCAWMNKDDNFNTSNIPHTVKGFASVNNIKLKNIDYACLVPYRPYPSRKGIERAIELGKKYYDSAKIFDEVTNEDYAMKSVNEEIQGLTLWAKRDIIRYELHQLYIGQPISHNDIIIYIQNKYDFTEDLITEYLLDLSSSPTKIKRVNNKYTIK